MYKYRDIFFELKADTSEGIVEGYFSAFGNTDAYGDIITPGAFAKTISERGPASARPRIKHIINHDITHPAGKLLELKEDNYGLFYRSKVGKHTQGQDFLKMAESGLITEHSIGFEIVTESSNNQTGIRELTELKLWEGSSLTGWGVNEMTPLTGIKAMAAPDRLKRLEKFIKNTDATDECIELLMIEIKQLTALLQAKDEITEPVDKTTPPVEKGFDWARVAASIN